MAYEHENENKKKSSPSPAHSTSNKSEGASQPDGSGSEAGTAFTRAQGIFQTQVAQEGIGWKQFQSTGHSPVKPELDLNGLQSVGEIVEALQNDLPELPDVLRPAAQALQPITQGIIQIVSQSDEVLKNQPDIASAKKTAGSVQEINNIITALTAAVTSIRQAREMLSSSVDDLAVEAVQSTVVEKTLSAFLGEKIKNTSDQAQELLRENITGLMHASASPELRALMLNIRQRVVKEKHAMMRDVLVKAANNINESAIRADNYTKSLPGNLFLDDLHEVEKVFGKSTPHILIAAHIGDAADLLKEVSKILKDIADPESMTDKIKSGLKSFASKIDPVKAVSSERYGTGLIRLMRGEFLRGNKAGSKPEPVIEVAKKIEKWGSKKQKSATTSTLDKMRLIATHQYTKPESEEQKTEAENWLPAGGSTSSALEQQGEGLINLWRGTRRSVTPFNIAASHFLSANNKIQYATEKLETAALEVKMAKNKKPSSVPVSDTQTPTTGNMKASLEAAVRTTLNDMMPDVRKTTSRTEKSETALAELRSASEAADVIATALDSTLAAEPQYSLGFLPKANSDIEEQKRQEFKVSLELALKRLKNATLTLKEASRLSKLGAGELKKLFTELEHLKRNTGGIKNIIKSATQSITLNKLNYYSTDSKLAKSMGVWADKQIKDYLKSFPDDDPETIKNAMESVFDEELKMHYGRMNDPDAVFLRHSLTLAISDAMNDTMALNKGIERQLAKSDTFKKYLNKWGARKLTAESVNGTLSSAMGMGAEVLELMVSLSARNFLLVPRLSWLKLLFTPVSLVIGVRALQTSVMPNEGTADAAVRTYLKRELSKAAFRLVTKVLPRGANLGIALSVTGVALYQEDRMATFKSAASSLPVESAFGVGNSGLWLGKKKLDSAKQTASPQVSESMIDEFNASGSLEEEDTDEQPGKLSRTRRAVTNKPSRPETAITVPLRKGKKFYSLSFDKFLERIETAYGKNPLGEEQLFTIEYATPEGMRRTRSDLQGIKWARQRRGFRIVSYPAYLSEDARADIDLYLNKTRKDVEVEKFNLNAKRLKKLIDTAYPSELDANLKIREILQKKLDSLYPDGVNGKPVTPDTTIQVNVMNGNAFGVDSELKPITIFDLATGAHKRKYPKAEFGIHATPEYKKLDQLFKQDNFHISGYPYPITKHLEDELSASNKKLSSDASIKAKLKLKKINIMANLAKLAGPENPAYVRSAVDKFLKGEIKPSLLQLNGYNLDGVFSLPVSYGQHLLIREDMSYMILDQRSLYRENVAKRAFEWIKGSLPLEVLLKNAGDKNVFRGRWEMTEAHAAYTAVATTQKTRFTQPSEEGWAYRTPLTFREVRIPPGDSNSINVLSQEMTLTELNNAALDQDTLIFSSDEYYTDIAIDLLKILMSAATPLASGIGSKTLSNLLLLVNSGPAGFGLDYLQSSTVDDPNERDLQILLSYFALAISLPGDISSAVDLYDQSRKTLRYYKNAGGKNLKLNQPAPETDVKRPAGKTNVKQTGAETDAGKTNVRQPVAKGRRLKGKGEASTPIEAPNDYDWHQGNIHYKGTQVVDGQNFDGSDFKRYRATGDTVPAEHAIISSHGVAGLSATVELPNNEVNFKWLTPHEHFLLDPGLDVAASGKIKPYVEMQNGKSKFNPIRNTETNIPHGIESPNTKKGPRYYSHGLYNENHPTDRNIVSELALERFEDQPDDIAKALSIEIKKPSSDKHDIIVPDVDSQYSEFIRDINEGRITNSAGKPYKSITHSFCRNYANREDLLGNPAKSYGYFPAEDESAINAAIKGGGTVQIMYQDQWLLSRGKYRLNRKVLGYSIKMGGANKENSEPTADSETITKSLSDEAVIYDPRQAVPVIAKNGTYIAYPVKPEGESVRDIYRTHYYRLDEKAFMEYVYRENTTIPKDRNAKIPGYSVIYLPTVVMEA